MYQDIKLIRKKKNAWFRRYGNQVKLLERLENKLQELEDRITAVKSPNYSGSPDTIADLITNKEVIKERLEKHKCKAKKLRKEIINALDCIDNDLQLEVLKRRYIRLQTIKYISKDMDYHERHITRVCTTALDSITIPGI